ncbi:uracil phosphoribosyltransferase [bacterium]|nr:uracil phosphoribosyltransferase [bacterium]
MEVNIITHSLAGDYLTKLRDRDTPTPLFRQILDNLAVILFVESSRDLPTRTIEIETPLERTIGAEIERQIVLVPILRAGLGMVDSILKLAPESVVMHLGVRRNEETLEPEPYYSALGKQIEGAAVFILDPMLATGGTVAYAVEKVAKYSPARIDILSVLAAPEGVEKLSAGAEQVSVPVRLWVAALDRELNERGYILPGLGDAGDRIFGTH